MIETYFSFGQFLATSGREVDDLPNVNDHSDKVDGVLAVIALVDLMDGLEVVLDLGNLPAVGLHAQSDLSTLSPKYFHFEFGMHLFAVTFSACKNGTSLRADGALYLSKNLSSLTRKQGISVR